MAPVVALAWNADARQLRARVRWDPIAASTGEAELAVNDCEGKWVS